MPIRGTCLCMDTLPHPSNRNQVPTTPSKPLKNKTRPQPPTFKVEPPKPQPATTQQLHLAASSIRGASRPCATTAVTTCFILLHTILHG